MPVCCGEGWLNFALTVLSRSGKLPPCLIDDSIRPFLTPVLGLVVAIGRDTLALVDAASGGDIWQKRLPKFLSPVPSSPMKVAPCGTMIFLPFMGFGTEVMCCMLNAVDGQEIWRNDFWMPGSAFSPSSQLLAGTGGKVRMLHAASGKELWTRDDIMGSRLEFAPNGEAVAVAVNETNSLAMLDVLSGDELWHIGPFILVTNMLFTSNGEMLIVSAQRKLASLDVHTGSEMWQRQDLEPDSLVGASDGKHVLVGSLNAVMQVDAMSGKELGNATVHGIDKSQKPVSMKMDTGDSAIAIRSNQVVVLDKKEWSAVEIITSDFAELAAANGQNVAVILQQHRKQSVAMMTSAGELLWTWDRGFVDKSIRGMEFLVFPTKAASPWHQQNQDEWPQSEVVESDRNEEELNTPNVSKILSTMGKHHLSAPQAGVLVAQLSRKLQSVNSVVIKLILTALICSPDGLQSAHASV